jgi:hypothetical protein
MPVGPSPIYVVTYDGDQFPGYVQGDDQPLILKVVSQDILNRNGGIVTPHGSEIRKISLDFIVLSRLGSDVTELQHLNDCKDQYRVAAAITARATGVAKLYIGNTDRHLSALPTGISAPLVSDESARRIRYRVTFDAEPYYVGETAITGSFSGNTTVGLVFATDSRETYPIFTIPSGVTGFTATHAASGKTIEFLRDTFTGEIVISTSNFTVKQTSNGGNASRTMQNVNYGMKWAGGTGTMSIVVTGFAGSGTVSVDIYPRYEL